MRACSTSRPVEYGSEPGCAETIMGVDGTGEKDMGCTLHYRAGTATAQVYPKISPWRHGLPPLSLLRARSLPVVAYCLAGFASRWKGRWQGRWTRAPLHPSFTARHIAAAFGTQVRTMQRPSCSVQWTLFATSQRIWTQVPSPPGAPGNAAASSDRVPRRILCQR